MSDQPQLTEKDLTNMVRGFGTPAPLQVLDKVLAELAKERTDQGKDDFRRGSDDDERGR